MRNTGSKNAKVFCGTQGIVSFLRGVGFRGSKRPRNPPPLWAKRRPPPTADRRPTDLAPRLRLLQARVRALHGAQLLPPIPTRPAVRGRKTRPHSLPFAPSFSRKLSEAVG